MTILQDKFTLIKKKGKRKLIQIVSGWKRTVKATLNYETNSAVSNPKCKVSKGQSNGSQKKYEVIVVKDPIR